MTYSYEQLSNWYKDAEARAVRAEAMEQAALDELAVTEQKLEEEKKRHNDTRQKLIYCAEELNHTAMILMGPLNYQIKDTNEGALELTKRYEALQEVQQKYMELLEDWEKLQEYRQSWIDAAQFWQRSYNTQGRENRRLREGLQRIYQRGYDEYVELARAILDGYDVKEEDHLDALAGIGPEQHKRRSAEVIWCPTCERYKDHYCEHIKYHNVKPCNTKYRGFFCAKPMGHEDLHKGCGGVEWSQAKPDETDK